MQCKNPNDPARTGKGLNILAGQELVPEKDKNYIIAALIVITDKFMSKHNKKKLLEVLKMTEIEQWLREELREERNEEIIQASLKQRLSIDVISKITGLDEQKILNIQEKPALSQRR